MMEIVLEVGDFQNNDFFRYLNYDSAFESSEKRLVVGKAQFKEKTERISGRREVRKKFFET